MSNLASAVFAGAVGAAAAHYFLSAGARKRPRLEPVSTSHASPAAGHYSQAVKNGGEVFVSGLLPIMPDGTKLSGNTFEAQATQVLRNLEAILHEAGSGLDRLIQVRVYITDVKNWGLFNEMYANKLGAHSSRSKRRVAREFLGSSILGSSLSSGNTCSTKARACSTSAALQARCFASSAPYTTLSSAVLGLLRVSSWFLDGRGPVLRSSAIAPTPCPSSKVT